MRSVRGVLSIACAVGMVAPPAGLPAQQLVRLELQGSPGDWLEYSHRSDLVVDLPADLGGPTTTRTTIRLRHLVDSVSPNEIGFVTTLEQVSLDVSPPQARLPDLSGMQGLQFRHSTSRSGRIVSVSVPGQGGELGPVLSEQVQSWLGQLGFPPLPEGPVAIGDEWSERVPVPAMALGLAVDYDVVQTRTVRLADWRSGNGTDVALLRVNTNWEPSSEPGGAGSGVVSLRGTATQTVRFDATRGRFLGSTGTRDLELVLTPGGGAQYVAVYAEGRQITGLTATSQPGP